MSRYATAAAAASMCVLAGCSDATSPRNAAAIPDFVFVSNETGRDRLYIFSSGHVTPFPGTFDGDADPQSAHGRIVFSSYRTSETSSEIYRANLDGSDLQRLTNNSAMDVEPSMSPDGSAVAFVRIENGVSRLWMMDAAGSNASALATGSDSHTPESLPRFSPDGRTILFSSSRTGTTQLWEMPAKGGEAVQVTREINGAFDGSWGADGASVFFVAGLDFHTVHQLDLLDDSETGHALDVSDVVEPECTALVCLAVTGADGSHSDIIFFMRAGSSAPLSLLSSVANEREPAILHR